MVAAIGIWALAGFEKVPTLVSGAKYSRKADISMQFLWQDQMIGINGIASLDTNEKFGMTVAR